MKNTICKKLFLMHSMVKFISNNSPPLSVKFPSPTFKNYISIEVVGGVGKEKPSPIEKVPTQPPTKTNEQKSSQNI
jgi:hypothetical protein